MVWREGIIMMASKVLTPTLVMLAFAALLLMGCATGGDSSDPAATDTTSNTAEPTVERTTSSMERGIVIGPITEVVNTKANHSILVEANPDANCRSPRHVLNNPECAKMGYSIFDKTRVLREVRGNRTVAASPAELRKGTRVRATSTGSSADSYPPQGLAHTVTILEPR